MPSANDLVERFHLPAKVYREYTIHPTPKSGDAQGSNATGVKWRRYQKLGAGTHGQVYLEKTGGQQRRQRAVKVIEKGCDNGFDYKRELLALSKLAAQDRRSFTVDFLGWFEDGPKFYLAMEYLAFGDLKKFVADGLSQDEIRAIARDLIKGLLIIHKEGITHRDLKPENILVKQKPPASPWWVKIGDFGISKRVSNPTTALRTQIGTEGYMAPEVLGLGSTAIETSVYDQIVDLWSLGCVIFNLATKELPFPEIRNLSMFCYGQKDQLRMDGVIARLGPDGAQLVRSLLKPRPCDRWTLEQARKSKWLIQKDVGQPRVTLSEKPPRISVSPKDRHTAFFKSSGKDHPKHSHDNRRSHPTTYNHDCRGRDVDCVSHIAAIGWEQTRVSPRAIILASKEDLNTDIAAKAKAAEEKAAAKAKAFEREAAAKARVFEKEFAAKTKAFEKQFAADTKAFENQFAAGTKAFERFEEQFAKTIARANFPR